MMQWRKGKEGNDKEDANPALMQDKECVKPLVFVLHQTLFVLGNPHFLSGLQWN